MDETIAIGRDDSVGMLFDHYERTARRARARSRAGTEAFLLEEDLPPAGATGGPSARTTLIRPRLSTPLPGDKVPRFSS
jgi:hypothetical protein